MSYRTQGSIVFTVKKVKVCFVVCYKTETLYQPLQISPKLDKSIIQRNNQLCSLTMGYLYLSFNIYLNEINIIASILKGYLRSK